MNPAQLRDMIKRVLQFIEAYSEEAQELLMLTAAVESNLGEYVRQKGGPALGIFQMEPATESDIYNNYLVAKKDLMQAVNVLRFRTYGPPVPDLEGNLPYQIAMARVHYMRVRAAIPKLRLLSLPLCKEVSTASIEALARYWKHFYNTNLGKGTIEKAVGAYTYHCLWRIDHERDMPDVQVQE